VIAAAGDIACDPSNGNFNAGLGVSDSCRQKYTSDLLVNNGLAAVADLGDNQYYCGALDAYNRSYDLSWGRVKSITRPSLGNHDYLTSGAAGCTTANAGAAGYFDYFGAAAGTRGKGYYSYNVGTWHIIVLNSNCGDVGGCSSTSPQGQWLKNDLATNPAKCTMAYWHIPLFSSGGRPASNSKSFWDALYAADADVIMDGHDHIYERFAPQTPAGALDPARGIRQFTAGTGGANHTTITSVAPNSEVRNADTYGVLKLTLHAGSYDWAFEPEAGGSFRDTGTASCHGGGTTTADTTPPTAPTNLTATPASASQVNLAWTASTDNIGVTGYQVFRNTTQVATLTTPATTYNDTGLAAATTYTYTVKAVDAAANTSNASNTATATT